MTATLEQFAAESDAKNTIHLKIIRHCYDLIDYLLDNYKRTHEGKNDYLKFEIESGKRYHKIVMITLGDARSIHAFVDKVTGDVYKPASWKAPAKGIRFNLLLIKDREWLEKNCDWAGSYLYRR